MAQGKHGAQAIAVGADMPADHEIIGSLELIGDLLKACHLRFDRHYSARSDSRRRTRSMRSA